MKTTRAFFLLVALIFLGSCTRAGFFIANIPADYVRHADIAYDTANRLDVYTPGEEFSGPRPVIVFFYGGRWSGGRRQDFSFVADRFTREGYVVVIPDHRKYPDVKFPVFVEDAAAAVGWVSRNIRRYRGDSKRLFLMGHSSGAHIASLLLADKHYLRDAGVNYSAIKAFAGLAGPYCFTPDEPDLIDMFGPPENYPLMQATGFIDGTEPPMLLLHGMDDKTVELYNLRRLEKAVNDKGGKVETILYEGVDHVGIVSALTWIFKGKAPVAEDVTNFFARAERP